ncbi:hypothetical protein EJ02DRAFT_434583 [Clathrospora elynae]|uniref:Uncharacterized protein n=1 Tax=Clathrospora elynae TaxID=706981 RepID=A0A6A5SLZ3_9PLEO|nr:hypothetical protein EJ02DRAFT_434583 [Clathrospora elynae]
MRQSATSCTDRRQASPEARPHRLTRSIDVRLKDVPEICNILLQLLRSLHRDLDDLRHQSGATTHISDAEDNHDNDNDNSESGESSLSFQSLSSSEGSQMQKETERLIPPKQKREAEVRHHVGDTIDRLQAQARRIEPSEAQHRRKRVAVYRGKEKPEQIYDGLKKIRIWKANEQYQLASEKIKKRMAESFARRRIRFAYLQEHQIKRAIDVCGLPSDTSDSVAQEGNGKDEAPAVHQKEAAKKPVASGSNYPQDQLTLFRQL